MASSPRHDWYLKEWMRATDTSGATLERETGWSHRIANQLANCRIRWNRDHLLLAATVLRIHPYELLMHPEDAMHVRRLRADMAREAQLRVAEGRADFTAEPPTADRLRPRGAA